MYLVHFPAVDPNEITQTQFRRSSNTNRVQTGSGTHAALYPLGTGALSLEVKRPAR